MSIKKYKVATKKAFTLTELSLALAFVGALFIMIATIVANMITIYQKGTTITNVNSVGQSMISDMSRSISEAPSFNIETACSYIDDDEDKNAKNACKEHPSLITSISKKDVTETGQPSYGGAFCTGKYSYIWNSGYVFSTKPEHTATIKYNNKSITDFRLIKIEDKKRLACAGLITGDAPYTSGDPNNNIKHGSTEFDLTGNGTISEEPVELIAKSDKSLALYSLGVIAQYNQTTKKGLYNITFVLGTVRGEYIIGSESSCKPPGEAGSDFEYCAINKFNFAIRTAGE